MFYMSIIGSVVLEATLKQAYSYKIQNILKGVWETEKVILDFDYYLEQITQLAEKSFTNEDSKIQLMKSYKLHQVECKIPTCQCHLNPLLNMKINSDQFLKKSTENQKDVGEKENHIQMENDINMGIVYQFIDGLFQWMFSQRCINQDSIQYERLSLKYISFMLKYQNNPVRAYYELKALQLKKNTFSIYFKMITQIIAVKIQERIDSFMEESGNSEDRKKGSSQTKKQERRSKLNKSASELTIYSIITVDQMCHDFIPQILLVIDKKYNYWNCMQKGYKTINDFQNDALKLMAEVNNLRDRYLKQMKAIKDSIPEVELNLQFQRITQIFLLFIANDCNKAMNLELLIVDLKKRDSLAESDSLKNTNLIKGEICILEISLSESLGRITNVRDQKAAQFFGYHQIEDFKKVNSINELMPQFIGKVHNSLIKSYIKGLTVRSQNGDSVVQTFMKMKDGYIHPIKVHFNFSFLTSMEDFRMHGILLKKVEDQSYIIFNRSGKIFGITANIAQIFFKQFRHFPKGEVAIQNLNALMLFPKIIKRILKHRQAILEDIKNRFLADKVCIKYENDVTNNQTKSASTMTSLIEDKGSMKFFSNPYLALRKFKQFLSRKYNQNQAQSVYNKIDILDKYCLQLLKQFENFDFEKDNSAHFQSSEALVSVRSAGDQSKDESNLFNLKSFTKTVNPLQQSQNAIEYKLNFSYEIQYCFLDQTEQQTKSISGNKKTSQSNSQNKKQNNNIEEFQDIFFVIKIRDASTKVCSKHAKLKPLNKFINNLASFFNSTTSIVQFANGLNLLTEQNFNLQDQKSIQKSKVFTSNIQSSQMQGEANKINFQHSFSIDDYMPQYSLQIKEQLSKIPKKLISLLSMNNQQSIDGEKNQQKGKNKKLKLSDQSLDQSFESDNKSENGRYEKILKKAIEQIYSNRNSTEYLDSCNPQIEKVISSFDISINQVMSLDPNYHIKKIIQKRSTLSAFSLALEIKFTETVLQIAQDTKAQKQMEQVQKNEEINQNPIMTFRQDHEIDFENLNDTSNDKIPSKNLDILDSKTQREEAKKVFIQNIQDVDNQQIQLVFNNQQIFDPSPKNQEYINTLVNQNIDENQQFQPFQVIDLDQQKSNINTFADLSARPIIKQTTMDTNDLNTKSQIATEIYNQRYQDNKSYQMYEMNKEEQNYEKGDLNVKQQIPSQKDFQILVNNKEQKASFQENKKQQSTFNSSKKQDFEGDGTSNEIIQQEAVAKILNQKGMVKGLDSINRNSVSSSSKTQGSYAGVFLKEIILRQKMPKSALQYRMLLIFFLISFLSLNIINLIIIQTDMQIFSSNVTILRQPRKFLRDYGKVLFGFYIELEIQLGYLYDPQGTISTASADYYNSGIQEYNTLIQEYSQQLIQLQQQQQLKNAQKDQSYQIYVLRLSQQINISFDLLFTQQQYYVNGISNSRSDSDRADSFLYLRQNYFQFSTQVINAVNFLVTDTLNAVDSLINKFTIVVICALLGIILISLISLPLLKAVNFYEERIMMVVTRISFDQAENEKCKLQICKQLVKIESIDWLNYNYFDIFNMQIQKNNLNSSIARSTNNQGQNYLSTFNSKINQQKTSSQAFKNKNMAKKELQESQITISNNVSFNNMTNTNDIVKEQLVSESNFQNSKLSQFLNNKNKNLKETKNISKSNYHQKNQGSNSHNKIVKNTSLLQSKIINQSLRIIDRFLTLLVLTTFNCIYFLIIIIYLTQSNGQLKIPVQVNQSSINLHIIMTNLKIATELLSFDYYILDGLWPEYQITNLQDYFNQVNSSIKQLIQINQQTTDVLYGSNPFPTSILSQLKDIQEGRGCQYLVTYPCQNSTQELGISQIITEKSQFVSQYPEVLAPNQPPVDQLTIFLNGMPHLKSFVYSFQSEDELLDVYSTMTNDSISTVSLSIQNFLQNYLIYAGTAFTLVILTVFIIHWILLFKRIQYMNLMLTMIPEEKLQEDIILHMVRQVHRL
ncbi:transmembrane protein, putative (macronuclear) [Tetrahymena thermophila SB210]|uniref:Transmembrane protein, putative n=1 Tax=Tetrahymena thermophila (strain SB210) TaxID=312017 RepID=W7XB35_TETTS|nr:transmembrane protein, putative [Tetrahymena thermophila SB210]EWS76590.1 transmembrane protein, putative [Tetrahymena thermophila SB210]|eukprot:XP_012650876.1 transmembrane protein, putative [Tetrahymena thermophila SB210]